MVLNPILTHKTWLAQKKSFKFMYKRFIEKDNICFSK